MPRTSYALVGEDKASVHNDPRSKLETGRWRRTIILIPYKAFVPSRLVREPLMNSWRRGSPVYERFAEERAACQGQVQAKRRHVPNPAVDLQRLPEIILYGLLPSHPPTPTPPLPTNAPRRDHEAPAKPTIAARAPHVEMGGGGGRNSWFYE